MLDSRTLHRSQRIVTGRDFTDSRLGKLFDVFVALEQSGRPTTNLPLLLSSLRDYGLPTTALELATWLEAHPTAEAHVEFHAAEIRKAADLRAINDAASAAASRAEQPGANPGEIAAWLSAKLASLSADRSRGAITAPEAVKLALESHKLQSLAGYGTGLRALDDAFGPLCPEQLIVLAARPGCGKSALALQIAADVARDGNLVLFASIEMTEAEQAERLLSRTIGEPVKRGVHSQEYTDRMLAVAAEAAPETLLLWKHASPRLHRIRAEAKLHASRQPLALLVIDYLQLVRADERMRDRHLEVGEISRGLKELAGELKCPVLALSQLNREAEGKRPALSMLRESGNIEQDADGVIFIHRDGEFDRDNRGEVELFIAKRRSGPGEVAARVMWDGPSTSFRDKAARDAPNYVSDFEAFNRGEF